MAGMVAEKVFLLKETKPKSKGSKVAPNSAIYISVFSVRLSRGGRVGDLEPALARSIPLGNISGGFAKVEGQRTLVKDRNVDLPGKLATSSNSHHLSSRSKVRITSQIQTINILNGRNAGGQAYGRRLIRSVHQKVGEDVYVIIVRISLFGKL